MTLIEEYRAAKVKLDKLTELARELTMTRMRVIRLLESAGADPRGFNRMREKAAELDRREPTTAPAQTTALVPTQTTALVPTQTQTPARSALSGRTCDMWCEGCDYLAKHGEIYCDYLLAEGTRRGCPPGRGCTKRRRPEHYRRDERLRSAARAAKAEAARQAKPARTAERAYRAAAFPGGSLDPDYRAMVQRERVEALKARLIPAQTDAIRQWRQARGLTQQAASALAGVSIAAWNRWERGIEEAHWDRLERLGCVRPSAAS